MNPEQFNVIRDPVHWVSFAVVSLINGVEWLTRAATPATLCTVGMFLLNASYLLWKWHEKRKWARRREEEWRRERAFRGELGRGPESR